MNGLFWLSSRCVVVKLRRPPPSDSSTGGCWLKNPQNFPLRWSGPAQVKIEWAGALLAGHVAYLQVPP